MEATSCKTIKNDEFTISRTFDIPREVLWKTITSEQWKSWWMPKKFRLYDAELHEGGRYYGCMEQSDGKDFCAQGKFLKIIPNEKIVMTDSFADRESIVAPADYYGDQETWPHESFISVSLDDLNGKTKLNLKHSGLKGYDCSNMEEGWNNFFDELEDEAKIELKGEYSRVQHEKTNFRE